MKAEPLKLAEQQWYAWQMIPGYLGTRNIPYFSPILIRKIRPMKTGRGILQLDFLNLLYADRFLNTKTSPGDPDGIFW